jgi:hypothetical protein
MTITSDFGRRVFALEIGGLSVRYLSDDLDVSSTNLDANLTTGVAYTNVQGIVQVGSYQASIDPAGGVAQYAPVSITLKTDRLRGTLTDPHVIFGRTGPRAADVQKAQISTNIPHEDSAITITVDQDFTSLSFPRVMHIGAETVRVSAATSTTLSISDRGVSRTPIQTHRSLLGNTFIPEIFTEIINFRGRKASLWMGQKRPDGSISDFTEIINGFIESSPSIEDGDSVSISLVPLTALVDNVVSETALKTGLLANYHQFTDEVNLLEYAITNTSREIFTVTGAPATSPMTVNLGTGETFEPANAYDVSLQDGDSSSTVTHPRFPRIVRPGTGNQILPTGITTGGSITFDTSNNANTFWESYAGSSTTRNAMIDPDRTEVKSFKITTGLQRFPQIINDVLIANRSTTSQGISGSFLNWTIDQNLTSINLESNVDRAAVRPQMSLYSSKEALNTHVYSSNSPAIFNGTIQGPYPTPNISRLYYPIDYGFPDDPFQADPISINGRTELRQPQTARSFDPDETAGSTLNIPIRGVARAFYQNGEPYILVKDNLGLPTSETVGISYSLQVVFYDRARDEESSQFFQVTHQSTATYGSTDVGFLLHLARPFTSALRSSFGDWEGYEPTKIYLATRLNRVSPGVALLRLLQSGGGSQINGVYDLGQLGLNLKTSEIDIDSFLHYESIPNLTIDLDLRNEGADFRELITPMLQAMGAVLVMRRTENGNCKIALQPIGLEQANASALTINNGDWLTDDPPTWDVYEDIVTQVEVNFDYDIQQEKLTTKRVFNNQEAINRYNGEQSKITLNLFGVQSSEIGSTAGDSFSYFLPVITRIFNLLSNPIRLWRGSIGTGQSVLMDVGRYALVNSPLLKGYGVDYGVENGVGFIRSIRQSLMGEGCEVELIHTGVKSTSWNDSAKVLSTPTTTTVTIDQDLFSNTSATGATVKDSDFFKVDDVVDYVPPGDHDNAITGLIISSIVDNGATATITFTTTHGITTLNGTLEPTAYASATADQKLDAYIANASGVLGASDDGKEYI